RVLRLPGFLHQKVDAVKGLKGTPFRVHVVRAESREVLPAYTLPQLLDGFAVKAYEADATHQAPAEDAETRKAKARPRSQRRMPLNVAEVRDALTFISPEERHIWLDVGMALASTRDDRAFRVWDEWSRGSDKYDEEDQYTTWESFRQHKQGDEAGAEI